MKKIISLCLITLLYSCGGGGGGGGGADTTSVVTHKLSGNIYYKLPDLSGGNINYQSETNKPVRNIYLELLRVSDDTVLDTFNTSELGYFEFDVTDSVDVYILIYTEMKSPSVVLEDNTSSNAIYALDSPTFNLTSDYNVNLYASTGWTGTNNGGSYSAYRAAGLLAIMDSVYTAIKEIQDVRPAVIFPDLKINWSENNLPTSGDITIGQIGTSHFDPATGELYILGKADVDTDEFDKHIIVHEWMHYFDFNLSRSDSVGGLHSTGDTKDMTLAFGEGFANALAAALLEDPDYLDTSGVRQQSTAIFMNIESDTDNVEGWFSEVSIHEIVYDIIDTTNGASDSLSLGIGFVYDVMTGCQKNTDARTSIFSFITCLKDLDNSYVAGLNSLTTDKSITDIADEFGTGEANFDSWVEMTTVYTNAVVDGGAVLFKLWGSGRIFNDVRNSRYVKFTATSSITEIRVQGTDTFIVDVYRRGTELVNGLDDNFYYESTTGALSPVLTNQINTTIGDVYIIKVYTLDDELFYNNTYVDMGVALVSI